MIALIDPMDTWRTEDTFVVDQLIRPIANLYRIQANGQPVAFVRQKKLAIKEDIRFFADESETSELFRIKARAVLEFGGRYDVATPVRRDDRRAREGVRTVAPALDVARARRRRRRSSPSSRSARSSGRSCVA